MSAPTQGELRDLLWQIGRIRGLTAADRADVERLGRDTDRAVEQLRPGAAGAELDVYVDRMRRVLQQADEIMAKYAG